MPWKNKISLVILNIDFQDNEANEDEGVSNYGSLSSSINKKMSKNDRYNAKTCRENIFCR